MIAKAVKSVRLPCSCGACSFCPLQRRVATAFLRQESLKDTLRDRSVAIPLGNNVEKGHRWRPGQRVRELSFLRGLGFRRKDSAEEREEEEEYRKELALEGD